MLLKYFKFTLMQILKEIPTMLYILLIVLVYTALVFIYFYFIYFIVSLFCNDGFIVFPFVFILGMLGISSINYIVKDFEKFKKENKGGA